MTKKGHRLTAGAFALSAAVLMANGTIAFTSLGEALILGFAGLFAVGVMAGASAPDWLEGVFFIEGKRVSIIPHRTLTHWLPVWLLALYFVYTLSLPWYVQAVAFGFIASAILHITMDAFSKSGVPLLLPLRRMSVRIPMYTTGGASEVIWSAVVVAFFIGVLMHFESLLSFLT